METQPQTLKLNPQQQRIVDHLDGPALVVAGAGSGKTRVIIQRAARLIQRGVAPSSILLVTFTNKAAAEMTRRLEVLTAGEGRGEHVQNGTFHSLGHRFLRRHAPLAGYAHNFTILDDGDAKDLMKAALLETVGKAKGDFPTAAVLQDIISLAFNRQMPLEELIRGEYFWLEPMTDDLVKVAQVYTRKKRENQAMDFDDLLGVWLRLLKEHPDLEMTRRIRYVMVDEYQDTNKVQSDILDNLCQGHRNLMAVGDDAQSIYSWRGAHFDNIYKFTDRFGGELFRLEENYRSTPEILELANQAISHNAHRLDKTLRAVRPAGELPRITHLYDMREEAEWISDRILEAHHHDGLPYAALGVLYRNHAQSAELQIWLTERNIPFLVRSGVKFFEQAHIKDILALVKVVFNPLDEVAWTRLLKMLPGVGPATAGKIFALFRAQRAVRLSPENHALEDLIPAKTKARWHTLAATFKDMLADGVPPGRMIALAHEGFYKEELFRSFDNPAERENDIRYLAEFAGRYKSVESFLTQLALVGGSLVRDQEEDDMDKDHLTLSTIHQAKGLEWERVFVMGLVEDQFPHAKCVKHMDKLEEERRLFYVAVTRAMRRLDITVPVVSLVQGQMKICRPSRFVEELPSGVAEVVRAENLEELTQDNWSHGGFTFE
ncbi:MAG: ATP-dependent helicase [Deltaproteobacteria bacterium]|nr:ATP-dependent helicase [Deltaproteobacteria bacterium]